MRLIPSDGYQLQGSRLACLIDAGFRARDIFAMLEDVRPLENKPAASSHPIRSLKFISIIMFRAFRARN